MNIQEIVNILVGVLGFGVLAVRQATWRYVDPARIWRAPLSLAISGIVVRVTTAVTVTGTDVLFLGVEAVLAAVVGVVMGVMTTFRSAPRADRRGRRLQVRSGVFGAVLWLVLVAFRIGFDVVGGHFGAHLLGSTGTVLLVIAVNRAAWAFVVDRRMAQRRSGMMVQ